MSNPPGTPIWYELMTPESDGAKAFYEGVVGWSIEPPAPGPVDYRMIAAPGGYVGGVMHLSEEMKAGGAHPGWLIYFGVADVDAAIEKAKTLGAHVFVPPTDIPGVGRFSLLGDPQGAPFYVMRGVSEQTSTVFARGEPGRASWNELWTSDIKGALSFYGTLLGFENRETMNMGPMGGYHFIDLGDVRLGAAAEMKDRPSRWNAYFNVPDIDAAAAEVRRLGGTVDMGPHEVPTGERILLGADPQGAGFALVAPQ